MKSDLIDVDVHLHHETKLGNPDEGAFLVSVDGDRKRAIWIPKSLCQIGEKKGNQVTLTMSEWTATDKGLV